MELSLHEYKFIQKSTICYKYIYTGDLNQPYDRYSTFIKLLYTNLSYDRFNNLPYLLYVRFIILP